MISCTKDRLFKELDSLILVTNFLPNFNVLSPPEFVVGQAGLLDLNILSEISSFSVGFAILI